MSFLDPPKPPAPPPQQQQQIAAAPAPPPAPDRSDEVTRDKAIAQRKKYGIPGGASANMATGGTGVASSSIYSAVTALLGGGA